MEKVTGKPLNYSRQSAPGRAFYAYTSCIVSAIALYVPFGTIESLFSGRFGDNRVIAASLKVQLFLGLAGCIFGFLGLFRSRRLRILSAIGLALGAIAAFAPFHVMWRVGLTLP